MTTSFERVSAPVNLHGRVIRALGVRVIEAERASERIVFPNEAELCQQLGVSRSILREAVKVLADKGMVEVRPRSGTRSRDRSDWNLLDPDILAWQAELPPDARFLRDVCEVRLAMEPTAAGFAALRASEEEIARIQRCLAQRESRAALADPDEAVDLDLEFHSAVVAASHNPLFQQSEREHPRADADCVVVYRPAAGGSRAGYGGAPHAVRSHPATRPAARRAPPPTKSSAWRCSPSSR